MRSSIRMTGGAGLCVLVATATLSVGSAVRMEAVATTSECVVTSQAGGETTDPSAVRRVDLSSALAQVPLSVEHTSVNQNGALSAPPTAGSDSPGSAAECQWAGPPISPTPPYYLSEAITVTLSVVPYSTGAVARRAYDSDASKSPAQLTPWPAAWSLTSVGDAATYVGPGPEDATAEVEVLSGPFVFTISVSLDSNLFGENPALWTTLARAVVAQLASPSTPSPTTTVPGSTVPQCPAGQLPDVGFPCNLSNSTALTTCPPGSGSDITFPGEGRFDAATETTDRGSFGGIYAHIYPAPACADSSSDPPTSAWVMLQAKNNSPHVFAQAGIFYGATGQAPGTDHPFFEVYYPGLNVNGTVELGFPLSSGTFTVQVYGPSNQAIPICTNLNGQGGCTSTGTTTDTEEIRFWINGKPYLAGFIPAEYTGDLSWADLAAEIHKTWSSFPGTCAQDLLFADAHVYQNGAWKTWDSTVTELDLPDTSAQVVRPGGMSVWTRQPSC